MGKAEWTNDHSCSFNYIRKTTQLQNSDQKKFVQLVLLASSMSYVSLLKAFVSKVVSQEFFVKNALRNEATPSSLQPLLSVLWSVTKMVLIRSSNQLLPPCNHTVFCSSDWETLQLWLGRPH